MVYPQLDYYITFYDGFGKIETIIIEGNNVSEAVKTAIEQFGNKSFDKIKVRVDRWIK